MTSRLAPSKALFHFFVVLLLSAALAACGGDAREATPESFRAEASLASRGGVPFEEAGPNRVGLPTSGGGVAGDQVVAAEDEDEEDKRDYWAPIHFDRDNFEEVRRFVRDRYIEADVDEARAYAEAASFALASDADKSLLLYPEAFYRARKGHADEEGRLDGKMIKLRPTDRFVILEEKESSEEDNKKRLSDDEIRALRKRQQDRQRHLDRAWADVGFDARAFGRVMDFVATSLGKEPSWSMKRAWIAAAQGYLYSLDPHSALIPKKAWDDSTKEITDSSFEGIGAILTRRADSEYTIVESPLPGQPAVKAGLRAGDVILAVDQADIKGELLSKVVSRIRGEKGTRVLLTVDRVGEPEPLNIGIIRSRIEIKNVMGRLVRGHEDIGYVKLTGFVPTTDLELGRLVKRLTREAKGKELRGLILDLRNNSGGLLKEGIKVADRFLDDGVIVTVKNRTGADEIHRATPDSTWDMPLVVLTNDGAASASEIVASAIQENRRGLVVGDRTFGKASVQTLFSPLLRDDYYIKLTVARYYSPTGRTLQVIGVKPDVDVPPEIDGAMPLGYREENLSRHLAPLDADYLSPNAPWTKAAVACADRDGKAKAMNSANPNPAVKFDYQLMRAADLLECMQHGYSQTAKALPR